jgi:two-component system cell cycle response regulator DivK
MKKVLVIEDNPDNLRLVAYALTRAGYEVISTESGEEGVDLAVRERPLFILMDINLPGIDGIEATRRIRSTEVKDSIPIIAITSYAMTGDRERIMSVGCNGYIEKPIDPIKIIDQIHGIIGLKNNENSHR